MHKLRSSKFVAAARDRELTGRAAPSGDHHRQWVHEWLQGLRHDSTILAVGCEQAFLGPQLAQYSAAVTVLDTSAAQLAQLARRFSEISFLPHDPAHPLPFARDSFDAICGCEFLDRVFDPAVTLREMHRVLAPGGRLLLTVPDHGARRNVFAALFEWGRQMAPSNPRIRHFTRGMLVKLAREAGFTAIHTARSGGGPENGGGPAPRSWLLQARKAAGMQPVHAASRPQPARARIQPVRELATGSRVAALRA